MKKYDLSDKDYKQCLKLNENSLMGMMGLGRNAQERGACTEANEYFNKVIKLYGSTYSSGYSFRAECYIKQGMFSAAADDIVNALYIDRDRKAFYWMLILADSSYMDINSRLKIQKNKEPNPKTSTGITVLQQWPRRLIVTTKPLNILQMPHRIAIFRIITTTLLPKATTKTGNIILL